MTAIVLSPHNDDCELFCCFNTIRHKASVIVCLRSDVQERRGLDITAAQREAETACAMNVLGVDWVQWPYLDSAPQWLQIEEAMAALDAGVGFAPVFAPAVEDGGHEHHNAIGEIAARVFGERLVPYLTYRRGHGRTVGKPVEFELHWPGLKSRALGCYESQIMEPSTRDWFLGEQYEYVPA